MASKVTAGWVLNAIKNKYPNAAIVPEVTIHDNLWTERAGESKLFRRIDALMFESLLRTAIEVKVDKGDYEADNYRKRAPWLNVCHRFVYVVPWYLAELKPYYDCGMWVVQEDGKIVVKKNASVSKTPEPLPQQVVQLLAYRAMKASDG